NTTYVATLMPHSLLLPVFLISVHCIPIAAKENKSIEMLLLNLICIRGLAFTHLCFRIVDLVGQLFIFWIKIERLLPCIEGLGRSIQFGADISEVFKHNRIVSS